MILAGVCGYAYAFAVSFQVSDRLTVRWSLPSTSHFNSSGDQSIVYVCVVCTVFEAERLRPLLSVHLH